MNPVQRRGPDRVALAGAAIFGAASAVLAYLSLSLGLNFPLIPYLQFDLGEVAILLAFFIFGPIPALEASVVEFLALMLAGVNAPWGPILKVCATTSTVVGMWAGVKAASYLRRTSVGSLVGFGTVTGAAVRAVALTFPNYYLIVFLYTVPAIVSYVSAPFASVGVSITDSNLLLWVLAFTAVFNVIQLTFVSLISYAVLRLRRISQLSAGGRSPWFVRLAKDAAADPR